MKLLPYLSATVLVTGAVAENNVVGPFALRITGKTDSSIDGYAWACHAGAATEGLCYSAGSTPVSGSVYEFYYNYSYYESYNYPGYISYVFTYAGADGNQVKVPSFAHIYPSWASNVHSLLIPPGIEEGTPVSLDFDTGFFYMGSLYDDTHWNATTPSGERTEDVSNFHLCYQWTGGYWFRSLAWVSGFEGVTPQNPSCQPVNLGVESLAPA
ncbi:hypothetical protein EV127DRAFT_494920 [Xylaria flabelliformis]|nr:hypothetical protein EV127DRAFT_494920 [Xylaria flabelliformis]KAI0859403.1 hypothetical protein F4860DRAFT_482626 [Xylaria cubensis]